MIGTAFVCRRWQAAHLATACSSSIIRRQLSFFTPSAFGKSKGSLGRLRSQRREHRPRLGPSPRWLFVAGIASASAYFAYVHVISPAADDTDGGDDDLADERSGATPSDRLMTAVRGSWRSIRTFATVSMIMADYKLLFWQHGHLGTASEEYKSLRNDVHQRSAERLLALCRSHGGIYTKAAQHVASLVNMVPRQYTDTLSVLQDKAPYRPFEEVCKVFHHEFNGKMPLDLFMQFEETPIAAASLAQVHHAITNDGRECAVKVQYPDVVQNFKLDIWCMSSLSKLVTNAFPEITLDWIIREFRSNLLHEFDFLNEARQATLTSLQFAHRGASFHVPRVYWDLSTPRVMTMEFIHGVKVTDVSTLRDLKLDTQAVARTLIEVFAEMVFLHGSVHCDPHPGNILVRFAPQTNQPQLVLLDHGLYRHLSPSFRTTYCDLWVALLTQNDQMLIDTAKRLGVSERHARHFPLIFTSRSPGKLLGEEMTPAEKRALIKRQLKRVKLDASAAPEAMSLDRVVNFLEALPREMLLVIRTGNLIGGVHRALGGDSLEKFRTQAWYAVWGRNAGDSGATAAAAAADPTDALLQQLEARLDALLAPLTASDSEQPRRVLDSVDAALSRAFTFHYPLRTGWFGWCREWLSVWWRLWVGINAAKAWRAVTSSSLYMRLGPSAADAE